MSEFARNRKRPIGRYGFAYLGEPGRKVAHIVELRPGVTFCGDLLPAPVNPTNGDNGQGPKCHGCAVELRRRRLHQPRYLNSAPPWRTPWWPPRWQLGPVAVGCNFEESEP